jgi:hypothetical protein
VGVGERASTQQTFCPPQPDNLNSQWHSFHSLKFAAMLVYDSISTSIGNHYLTGKLFYLIHSVFLLIIIVGAVLCQGLQVAGCRAGHDSMAVVASRLQPVVEFSRNSLADQQI